MKNFKQVAFGLIVGALAISFSAFTTAHNNNSMKITRNAKGRIISVTASYYRIPAFASTATDLDPTHYEFENGPRSGCNSNPDICNSQWTTTNAPSAGETPSMAGSPSFVTDNTPKGVYNGL